MRSIVEAQTNPAGRHLHSGSFVSVSNIILHDCSTAIGFEFFSKFAFETSALFLNASAFIGDAFAAHSSVLAKKSAQA